MKSKFIFLFVFFILFVLFSFPKHILRDKIPSSTYSWDDEKNSSTLNPLSYVSVQPSNENSLLSKYENHFLGFSLQYPSDWNIDDHQYPNYTRLYNSNFRIDITLEKTKNDWQSPNTFINTTIDSIKNNITSDSTILNSEFRIHEFDYKRPIFFSGDMNAYSYFFLTKGNDVFTFQLKTTETNFDYYRKNLLDIIRSFSYSSVELHDLNTKIKNNSKTSLSYIGDNYDLLIPKNQFVSGIYQPNVNQVPDLEERLNVHFGGLMLYYNMNSKPDPYISDMIKNNRVPLITLQFTSNEKPKESIMKEFYEGKYDENIKNWADMLKNQKAPIFVRIGNEMNGNWTLWSYKYIYNDPDIFKTAYRHIVNIFRNQGAENVYFVWNPNSHSQPDCAWNHQLLYYPGDNYVNVLGLTSYNFGNTSWGGKFSYFDDLYQSTYHDYLRMFPNKPMMITEFASAENGGDKSSFIKNAYSTIPVHYPKIKLVFWFNQNDGVYQFKFDSSKNSEKSFKKTFDSKSILQFPYLKK